MNIYKLIARDTAATVWVGRAKDAKEAILMSDRANAPAEKYELVRKTEWEHNAETVDRAEWAE